MADATPAGDQNQGNDPSRDMSPYIRTYAKDVARLTNQPVPQSPKPAAPAADSVTLPEFDASPVNRPGGIVHDFPQETLELSKDDSADIFTVRRPAPTPPAPTQPPPPPAPPSPSADEQREAVLARLRQKVAAGPVPPPVPPPPPTPVFVPPAPVPPPPPYVPPAPVPPPPAYTPPPAPPPQPAYVPPAPPAYIPPAPVPPPIPAPPPYVAPAPPSMPPPGVIPLQKDAGAPSLHTYTSDFADRIDSQRASTFSVLAAEKDAGTRRTAPKKERHILPVVFSVLLIVLGAGGLFAAYQFTTNRNVEQATLGVPSLIYADEKMELMGPNYRQDLADAAGQPLVEGNILVTYVTEASSTPLGLSNSPQPGGALIRRLSLGAPDILMRNVDLSSTVGVIAAGGETRPFFILRVNSYERTFAGMLGWENRMVTDLGLWYPEYATSTVMPEPVTPTTATSSIVMQPLLPPAPQNFVDAVVANHDVRVLRDRSGRSLILYGYADRQTLIIVRDEAAFTALVARLTATTAQP